MLSDAFWKWENTKEKIICLFYYLVFLNEPYFSQNYKIAAVERNCV